MATWCEDPWLKKVREWGYIPVLQPRTGFAPLRVLRLRGSELGDIGSVVDLFVPGDVQVPELGADKQSVNRRQVRSGRLKLGLGVHFLHGALDQLGIKGASPRVEHKNARFLRFTASDIWVSTVDLLGLDRFLASADVIDDAPTATKLLTAEAVFVCTEVIKARQLVVEGESSHEESVGVPPVPVQPGVSASAEVSGGSAIASRSSYTGDQAAVFGLKAVQIRFSDGKYHCLEDAPGGLVVKAVPGPGGPIPKVRWLETDAPFLTIPVA